MIQQERAHITKTFLAYQESVDTNKNVFTCEIIFDVKKPGADVTKCCDVVTMYSYNQKSFMYEDCYCVTRMCS